MHDEAVFGKFLAQWERLVRAGANVSVDQFCAAQTDLSDDERVRLRAELERQAYELLGNAEPPSSSQRSTRRVEADKSVGPTQPFDAASEPTAPANFSSNTLDLRAGTEPIPGYQLVRRLGQGGFGEVWQATAPGGFNVALKFVLLEEKVGAVELASLEIVKNIRHPNLLTTFGAWQREPYLIIAMELADKTLMDRFQQTQSEGLPGIPHDELIEYFREAAKGIDYLNEPRHALSGKERVSIQHRDIKPQNILLVGNGVKVADFGLVRFLERSVTGHTGKMTPAYAAPEFFRGQTSSHSDQYCLAVTYCLLRGGRLPFGGTQAQILAGHLMKPPDLTMLPPPEQPVVARALDKEPNNRWPSCRAFVEELAQCRTGPSASKTARFQTIAPAATSQLAEPTETPPVPKAREPGQSRSSTRRTRTTVIFAALSGVLLAVWAIRQTRQVDNPRLGITASQKSLVHSTTVENDVPPTDVEKANEDRKTGIQPTTEQPANTSDRQPGNTPAAQETKDVLTHEHPIISDEHTLAKLSGAKGESKLALSGTITHLQKRLRNLAAKDVKSGRLDRAEAPAPSRTTTRAVNADHPPAEVATRTKTVPSVRTSPDHPRPPAVGPAARWDMPGAAKPFSIAAADPRELFVGGDDGRLRLILVEPKNAESAIGYAFDSKAGVDAHSGKVHCIAVDGAKRLLLSAGEDKTVRVFSLPEQKLIQVFRGHTAEVYAASFLPNRHRPLAVSAGKDTTVRVWDYQAGAELRQIEIPGESIWWLAPTSGGEHVATASDSNVVRVWNLDTGQEVNRYVDHKDVVWAVAVSPDDKYVLSGGGDQNGERDYVIRVWDRVTAKVVHRLSGHRGAVGSIAVSPDGRRAVSASTDRTVRLWDIETASELACFEGHTGTVERVVFLAGARLAASAALDGTVRIWKLSE
jgi:serine/threonine protein kinase